MNAPPLAAGEQITLLLESLAAGGEMVAHRDGLTVFVVGGAPGDLAEVEITAVHARYAQGRLLRVVKPSPDRIPPRCPHFGECGGCELQHIYYPAQLGHKRRLVADAIAHLGRLPDVLVEDTVPAADPWGYRAKVEYAATLTEAGLAFGFLRQGTHEVAPITGCAVAHPLNERIRQKAAETLQAVAQGHEEKTSIYKLICRTSVSRNEALVTLVVGHAHPFLSAFASQLMEAVPEVVGVAVARARGPHTPRHSPAAVIAGRKHLVERVGEFDYRVSADAFFQVNPASAGVLVDTALEFAQVTAEDRIVDGYCGVGLFLLPLAARARRGWGLEEDEAALVDARANLRAAHLGNCTLYQGPVERTLPKLSARRRAEVICLDPPRRGCGRTALVGAVAMRPRAIIVVSCEPATLARDLAVLQSLGFRTSRVRPVDLFPHTWHVEAVAHCVPG